MIARLLLILMAVGTAGYHFMEGWPWFDGFYRVVPTLTTIGYQEVHPLAHVGWDFNVIVIPTGVSLVWLGVGGWSQALLEFELQSFFGRRRMERDIGRPDGHYTICGMGRVGGSVARELAGKPARFVMIESSEAKRQRYHAENWLVGTGDATEEQVFRGAQIGRACGPIAATTTEATNLYLVLTARGLNPQRKIVAPASEDDAERDLLAAGADSVVSPYSFAGWRVAQSPLRPHVVSFLDTATTPLGTDLEIGEIHIASRSVFAGATIESSRIPQDRGVIIFPVKRHAGMRCNPAPDEPIEPEECLIAMGEPSQLRQPEPTATSQS
jgi:voltage-gated potassium channel